MAEAEDNEPEAEEGIDEVPGVDVCLEESDEKLM